MFSRKWGNWPNHILLCYFRDVALSLFKKEKKREREGRRKEEENEKESDHRPDHRMGMAKTTNPGAHTKEFFFFLSLLSWR